MQVRGPTVLALAAFLATFALVFTLVYDAGTVYAAHAPDSGFVTGSLNAPAASSSAQLASHTNSVTVSPASAVLVDSSSLVSVHSQKIAVTVINANDAGPVSAAFNATLSGTRASPISALTATGLDHQPWVTSRGSPALISTVALGTNTGTTARRVAGLDNDDLASPVAALSGLALVSITAFGVGFVFRRVNASMTFGLRPLTQDATGHVPIRAVIAAFAGFATRAVAIARRTTLRGMTFGSQMGVCLRA